MKRRAVRQVGTLDPETQDRVLAQFEARSPRPAVPPQSGLWCGHDIAEVVTVCTRCDAVDVPPPPDPDAPVRTGLSCGHPILSGVQVCRACSEVG